MPNHIATAGTELSASEIAALAGVSPSAVSNWRKRHADFPKPIDSRGRQLRYRNEDVRAWLTAHGRLPATTVPSGTIQNQLLHCINLLRGLQATTETLLLAGAQLATLVRPQTTWILERIRELTDDIPSEHRATIADVCTRKPDSYDEIADTLLAVTAKLSEDWSDNHHTKHDVATFIGEVLRPADDLGRPLISVIFDPCVGTGRLLSEVSEHWEAQLLVGQEIDTDVARLTSLILTLKCLGVDISAGDSLTGDNNPDLKADIVVASPPFGLRLLDVDDDDPRWLLGNPGRDGANAWIQIALSKLTGNGQAAVVVEPGWAWRKSSKDLRAALVRQNLLDGVIALPRGSFAGTPLGGLLIVLAKDRNDRVHPREPGEVLLVDYQAITQGSEEEDLDYPLSEYQGVFANWRYRNLALPHEVEPTIIGLASVPGFDELFRGFSGPALSQVMEYVVEGLEADPENQELKSAAEAIFGIFLATRTTSYESLAAADFNLTPRRHLALLNAFPGSFSATASKARTGAEKAKASASSTRKALTPVANFYSKRHAPEQLSIQLSTLGELEQKQEISLIVGKGAGKKKTTDSTDRAIHLVDLDNLHSTGEPPVLLTAAWIQDAAAGKAREPSSLVTKSTKLSPDSLIEVGDVIVSTSAHSEATPAVFTATKDERGAVLGVGLFAIRVAAENPNLTPKFIATWCRTTNLANQLHQFSVGEVLRQVRSTDLRKIAIPLASDKRTQAWFTTQLTLNETLVKAHKELSDFIEKIPDLEAGFLDALLNEHDDTADEEELD